MRRRRTQVNGALQLSADRPARVANRLSGLVKRRGDCEGGAKMRAILQDVEISGPAHHLSLVQQSHAGKSHIRSQTPMSRSHLRLPGQGPLRLQFVQRQRQIRSRTSPEPRTRNANSRSSSLTRSAIMSEDQRSLRLLPRGRRTDKKCPNFFVENGPRPVVKGRGKRRGSRDEKPENFSKPSPLTPSPSPPPFFENPPHSARSFTRCID